MAAFFVLVVCASAGHSPTLSRRLTTRNDAVSEPHEIAPDDSSQGPLLLSRIRPIAVVAFGARRVDDSTLGIWRARNRLGNLPTDGRTLNSTRSPPPFAARMTA